jgi:hypothetical protein
MNEQQIVTIALTTVPTMITVLIGILVNNARLGDLNALLNETNSRISELRSDINLRFEETKDLWRSELLRVEGILDVRLKHFEER